MIHQACRTEKDRNPARIDRRALLTGLFALSGCAEVVRSQPRPTARLEPAQLRHDTLVADDGAHLPLRVWKATSASGAPVEPWAVILGLHGFNDTAAESFVLAGPAWARMGITTYAFDQRGFGRAPGRGRWAGERALAADVRTACRLLREAHPGAILTVAGESMGGAIAISAFGSGAAPDADRLVLLSPAVWGWDRQTPVKAAALKLFNRLAPGLAVELPDWIVDDDDCTDNRALIRRMAEDPDEINAPRVDATYGLVNLMQSAEAKLAAIEVDTIYMYGAHDRLIPKPAAFAAAAALGPGGRTAYYPDGWHLLNRDLHAARVLTDVAGFTRNPKDPLPSAPPPIPVKRA